MDVTAVDGATTVQPNESATVSSADGMATLMLPTISRARTYQVMVDSDASTCAGVDSLPGSHQAGANISVYDAEGNMESGVTLIRRATVQMMLSSDAVDDLGGLPVVFQANALGAFSVHQQSAGDNWSMRRSSMGLGDDGAVTVTVTSLSSLGCLALRVDDGLLEQAAFQVAGITPTPVPPPGHAGPDRHPRADPDPRAGRGRAQGRRHHRPVQPAHSASPNRRPDDLHRRPHNAPPHHHQLGSSTDIGQ